MNNASVLLVPSLPLGTDVINFVLESFISCLF